MASICANTTVCLASKSSVSLRRENAPARSTVFGNARPLQRVTFSRPARTTLAVRASNEDIDLLANKVWPAESYSHVYEDIVANLKPLLFKRGADPDATVGSVMSKRTLYSARPDAPISSVKAFFSQVTGLPVLNKDGMCVGVLSKHDIGHDDTALIASVMTSPARIIRKNRKVADAAALMLKYKIHRLPVADDDDKIIGVVTRTDIFTAMLNSHGALE